jgi:hypothetical protein
VSVGLIVALIVAIAVVLSFAVDNDDDQTERTVAPPAPLSYINNGAGEGFLSGESQAVVPMLRAHTGDFQGDGLLNTIIDPSMTAPATGYHPYTGDVGLIEGSATLSYEEQARLANDEMLFEAWNDPLGWQATSEPQAAMSYDDMLYLEMNGVYDFGRDLAVAPAQPAVDDYARQKFIEWNTNLPSGTDDTAHRSDRERFSMN